jgi:RNA polymerase sigma-70 factor (ECF subfamily)
MAQISKKTIEKFKAGDADAFDIIYHGYSKKLYRFALGLLKDHDISSEILQEVFVNLWVKREQVDASFGLDNYLFTITYNAIRRHFKKISMEQRVIGYLQKISTEIKNGTDELIIYHELLDLANNTIEKLPEKRKIVYKLSRQEGLKIKEIARTMKISPRTAETHLAKALKFLKKELAALYLL